MIKRTVEILLIEDNPGDVRLINELLKEAKLFNYYLTNSITLKEGLKLIQEKKPDIVLLDINLPDSLGQQTFNCIYENYPDIPIILVSGLDDEELSIKLITLGAQDYINKSDVTSRFIERSISHSLERNKLRMGLIENKEFTQRIISSSNDCIKVLDLDGNLLSMSEGGQKLLEIENVGLYLNKSWVNFWEGDDLTAALEAILNAKQGESKRFTGYCPTEKGTPKWWEINVSPIKDAYGKIGSLLALSRDITERKKSEIELKHKNEQLVKLNAEKDKFFSIIAHDLKSPFNSIVGFSELLREQMKNKDYESIEEYAEIIQQSSQRAMELLINLMEWAQSQTGRIKFNPTYFDLEELIDEISKLTEDAAKQKSITITKNLIPHNTVFADKNMISTVLRNLVANAIKFTYPHGEINISSEENNGILTISITDNGIGIANDRLEKIFKLNESYSTPGTQNEKGTGLGLVLCKDFIEKHNGKIWASSVIGGKSGKKGSKFSFTLPVGDNHNKK